MDIVCREMYRAASVEWSPEAEKKVAFYEEAGYGKVKPQKAVCFLLLFCFFVIFSAGARSNLRTDRTAQFLVY